MQDSLIKKFKFMRKYKQFLNENKQFLLIYKNTHPTENFSHTVLKGNDLYYVNIHRNSIKQWKYIGKVDRKLYLRHISGRIVKNPAEHLVINLQQKLEPIK